MTTHYLITKNHEAIGVDAKDGTEAWTQAEKMGILEIVVRVDKAIPKEEWDKKFIWEEGDLNVLPK